MNDLFGEDPWAGTLADEPESQPQEAPNLSVVANTAPTNVVKGNMTENTGDKVVVTLKGGAGYDAPWIVFHGATAHEVDQTIKDAFQAGLQETVKRAAALFSPKANAPQAAPQMAQQAPAAASMPPGMSSPQSCEHGAYVFKEGVSAKGPWKAFMCPSGSRTCPPKWLPKG